MSHPHTDVGAGTPGESVWPLLSVVLRWRWLTIVTPIALAIMVGVGSLQSRRQYVAHASFVPQDAGPSRGSLGAIAAQLGMPQLSSMVGATTTATPQFYNDLLHSREVLRAAVIDTYTVTAGRPFRGTLIQYFKIRKSNETDAVLAAIKQLDSKVLATAVDRNTGIVRLSIRTKDRELSQKLARRLLDLVNDFNLRRRQSQVGSEAQFTERRSREALSDLRRAEGALAAFHSRNRQYESSPDLRVVEAGLQRQVTMAQQIYMTLAQQYEMAKVEAVRTTPVITVLDSPERLVEELPRGTVKKAALTWVLASILAFIVAATFEQLERMRTADSAGYRRLRDIWQKMRTPGTRERESA